MEKIIVLLQKIDILCDFCQEYLIPWWRKNGLPV